MAMSKSQQFKAESASSNKVLRESCVLPAEVTLVVLCHGGPLHFRKQYTAPLSGMCPAYLVIAIKGSLRTHTCSRTKRNGTIVLWGWVGTHASLWQTILCTGHEESPQSAWRSASCRFLTDLPPMGWSIPSSSTGAGSSVMVS